MQLTRICLFAVLPLLVLAGGASANAAPDAQTASPSVGCQLADVAFCDGFNSGPSQGGKSGDLNPALWHITRINPAYQFAGNWSLSSYNEFPAVPVTPCRAGISAVVPHNDAIICDAASGHGGELMTAIMAQFYGLYSMRPNQAFDFAGRTGTITFDVDAATGGGLDKWVSVYITDEPVNGAHSLQHTTGLQPNKGVGVEFAVTCGTNYEQVAVSNVLTYNDHVQTTAFAGDNSGPCVKTSKGKLNHFEIRLSQSQVDIWGSDFSDNQGANFPNFRLLQSVPTALSLNRGYVHFQVGIRAPLKYASSMGLDTPYAQYYWKNLGFDGPAIAPNRVYQIGDAVTPAPNGGKNLGYKILDGSISGQQQGMYTCCAETRLASLAVNDVDLTNATGAFLTLDAYLTPGGDFNVNTFAIKYRLNGGAWKSPLSTPNYATMVHDSTWWSGLVLPISVSDLQQGDNTLEFTTENGNRGYPVVISNIDLVLSASGGGSTAPPTVTSTPTPQPVTNTPTTNTPTPTRTPAPTPVSGGTATIDFNGLRPFNRAFNGQYPTGVANWGTNVWYLSGPWRQFTTNSIGFNGPGPTSASFTFIAPRRLVQVQAYNGGNVASNVSASCAGQATVSIALAARQQSTLVTNWTGTCSTVTLGSTNGWDTNFDDLVTDSGGAPGPTSTLTPTSTPTSVPATATATPTPTNTPLPSTAGPTPTPTPTSGPSTGCQLNMADQPANIAFCDTFANPMGIGNRSGDLNGVVWGVSRTSGSVNQGQNVINGWASTQLVGCDGTTVVAAPDDIHICNGQVRQAVNDGGDVTVLAMYPKQPFDFAGRTGTVAFDVSNDSGGTHAAWPEFWMTDQPVPAPFTFNDGAWRSIPRHGFGIRLGAVTVPDQGHNLGLNCPVDSNWRWTVDSVTVIRDYAMEAVNLYQTGAGLRLTPRGCVIASSGPNGGLNHVEFRVSQNQIDVYATDAGTIAPLKHIASITNANLSFTRGLIWLEDAHYNANKGARQQAQHTFAWDNVAFDGPFTYRDYSYDALDANVLNGYGTYNLGKYSFPPQTVSWNVLGLPKPGTITADVVRLMFNFFHYDAPTVVNLTVNGRPHTVPWPYPDRDGWTWRSFAVAIPITELVEGTNVVTIGADTFIATSNVNIVLVNGVFQIVD